MLISLLSVVTLAQSASDLAAPPIQIRKAPECTCTDETPDGVLVLSGLVVDAELTLAEDGRSPNERQATIFDVSAANALNARGRTKIWHSTNPASCGLTFDYGLQYSVAVRRTENGALETDECLMRSIRTAE